MGLLRPATPLLAPSLLASALLGSTPLLAPPVLGSPLFLWPAPPILAPSLLAPPLLVRVIVGAPNENGGSAAVCITAPEPSLALWWSGEERCPGRRSCDSDWRRKAVHALPRGDRYLFLDLISSM